MTKEKILDNLKTLPDKASIDDAIEHLIFMRKIEIGLEQAENGQTMSTEEAMKRLEKWSK